MCDWKLYTNSRVSPKFLHYCLRITIILYVVAHLANRQCSLFVFMKNGDVISEGDLNCWVCILSFHYEFKYKGQRNVCAYEGSHHWAMSLDRWNKETILILCIEYRRRTKMGSVKCCKTDHCASQWKWDNDLKHTVEATQEFLRAKKWDGCSAVVSLVT